METEKLKPEMKSFKNRFSCINVLSAVAVDLMSAPASQAYAEHIFSVSGYLTARKKKRTHASLDHRMFLKANMKIASL